MNWRLLPYLVHALPGSAAYPTLPLRSVRNVERFSCSIPLACFAHSSDEWFALTNTKAQSTKTKQTAAACYADRSAEAEDLLKRITSRLAQHQKEQAAEPTNWGYAGDLGRVTEELAYVLASLGDRSAVVDAKGLVY